MLADEGQYLLPALEADGGLEEGEGETCFQVGGGVSVVRLGGLTKSRRAPVTIIIMQFQLKSCCCYGEAIRGVE